MTTCVFCKQIATEGALVAERPTAGLLRDRFPVTDGHLLAVTKRHLDEFFELEDAEIRDLWLLLRDARERIAHEDPSVEGFNVGVNAGVVAGQTISHVHIHLIPRRAGDIDDPRGGVRGVIPDRMKY
jgi:ATP adenylyltransferase